MNLIVQCHDVTVPHSFPSELHMGPNTQIRTVFAGRESVVTCTVRFPRWFISRELALVSPPAAEILTPLQAVTLKLFITPGVFKVAGWKKLHFQGEKKCFSENKWVHISTAIQKTDMFYLEIWKDSKFSNPNITVSANIIEQNEKPK